ncbi:MAG: hypothetical protein V3S81_04940 [Anaerolineales bacterium]
MRNNNWQIPPAGGHMDAADGIYFQNMNMKEAEARLKGPLDGGKHLYTVAWSPC